MTYLTAVQGCVHLDIWRSGVRGGFGCNAMQWKGEKCDTEHESYRERVKVLYKACTCQHFLPPYNLHAWDHLSYKQIQIQTQLQIQIQILMKCTCSAFLSSSAGFSKQSDQLRSFHIKCSLLSISRNLLYLFCICVFVCICICACVFALVSSGVLLRSISRQSASRKCKWPLYLLWLHSIKSLPVSI